MPARDEPIGRLLSILKLFGIPLQGQSVKGSEFPYRLRDDFLSAAEQSFLQVLTQVLPPTVIVCPKVRVGDVLHVPSSPQWHLYNNKIHQKHIDFLIASRTAFTPLAAIELDDASHASPERVSRDAFMDGAFGAAGLPLIHVIAQRTYPIEILKIKIVAVVNSRLAIPQKIPPLNVQAGAAPPRCPKCGIAMVSRTSARGRNAGEEFYGCRNYPRCRETARITG